MCGVGRGGDRQKRARVEFPRLDHGLDPVTILSVLGLLKNGRVPVGLGSGPFSHSMSDDVARPQAPLSPGDGKVI